jgi:hypothetical protein
MAGDADRRLRRARTAFRLAAGSGTHSVETQSRRSSPESRQLRLQGRAAILFAHRVEGVVFLQTRDQALHHPAELIGTGGGEIIRLEGVFGKVVELVMSFCCGRSGSSFPVSGVA